MLELVALAVHLTAPPDPDWSMKKHLLRTRLAEVVATANALHGRDDALPRLVLERQHGTHGAYDHAWDVMTLDLESVHDPEKFWHVYKETVAHEWAHRLNDAINDTRGHGESFRALLEPLRARSH